MMNGGAPLFYGMPLFSTTCCFAHATFLHCAAHESMSMKAWGDMQEEAELERAAAQAELCSVQARLDEAQAAVQRSADTELAGRSAALRLADAQQRYAE